MSKLPLAYAIRKKATKKKMASGGEVPQSAAQKEKRPMPEQKHDSTKMIEQAPPAANPSLRQAKKNFQGIPKKHPRMAESSVVKAKLYKQEMDQMDTMEPNNGPQEQPPEMYNEEEADRQGLVPPAQKHFAEGGSVEQERDIMEAASIAASIMAKKRMARGGEIGDEILSADSIYESESEESDLSRNAQEDANMEDQLSFDALRKENYSESEGLEALDQPEDSNMKGQEADDDHDMSIVGSIRRKMKKKSPISK